MAVCLPADSWATSSRSIGRIQILSRTTLNSTTEQPNRAADTVHQLAVLVAVLPSAKKGAESAVPIQHNGPRRRHHSKKQRASVASMAQHVCYINICHTPRQISESGRVEIPNAAAVADLSDGQFAIISELDARLDASRNIGLITFALHSQLRLAILRRVDSARRRGRASSPHRIQEIDHLDTPWKC